jgi:hypothetical protein
MEMSFFCLFLSRGIPAESTAFRSDSNQVVSPFIIKHILSQWGYFILYRMGNGKLWLKREEK